MTRTAIHPRGPAHVVEDFVLAPARRDVPGRGLSRLLGRLVPQSLRPLTRRVVTDAISPYQRGVARRLGRQRPLKLNLGCGTLRLDGWVNVDLIGLPVDLAWNLARPLPFASGSVNAIFHEHVLEHLTPHQGLLLLRECRRVLHPDGIMRAAIPDAARYIASYVDSEHEFLNAWRKVEERGLTPLLGLQEEFHGFGHRALYDFETFALFCRAAGFARIESMSFGQSQLAPCPDSDWRQADSFYADVFVE